MPTPRKRTGAEIAVRPQEITVRPIRFDEIEEGRPVYRLRDHAGALSLDPAILRDVKTKPIRPGGLHPRKDAEPVGQERRARIKTVYGTETSINLYDNDACLRARYDDSRFPEDLARAVDNQADPGAYVEDPEGDVVLPITPVWGAEAYVTLFAPGIDPDDLEEAVRQVLATRFPGARLSKVKTRPVADRRVNVYERDELGRYDPEKGSFEEVSWKPRALHILEAESKTMISGSGTQMIEWVHPDAEMPIVG